jgi:hypothetical protein
MFKEDLIKCIYIGFKEGKDEIDNEDDEDYLNTHMNSVI